MPVNHKLSALLILLLVPIGVLVHKVIFTTLDTHVFKVKTIEIKGIHLSMTADFQAILSEISNQSLSDIDIWALKDRFSNSDLVENAVLTKKYPFTLAIHITERKPLALIKVANTAYTVDKNGVILPISSPDLIPIEIGFGLAINGSRIVDQYIIEMLQSLESEKQDVASINIDKNRRAEFKLHKLNVNFMIDKHILSKEFINKAQKIKTALSTNANKIPKKIDLYSSSESSIGYF